MNNIQISHVEIKRVAENKWLVWFASCVLNDCIRLNNIAIFKRLNVPGYRLVFPEKKVWENKIQIFFPLTKWVYTELESELTKGL